ncbi:MAG: caspase family protein [Acetobacteraceae bacterium]
MPLRRLLPLVALLLLLAPETLAQDRRVALVVGNGAYRHASALANPGNDAEGVARTLADLGFRVTLLRDLGVAAFREALLDFGDAARGADVALFFFAGHGLQMGLRDRAENFLVPVDAQLADARRLEDETIRLSRVLELMETARARVVILDACRDNPLIAAMANTGGTRSVGRGLAPIEGAAQGTLIAFSTAPGAVAADGRGGNSPFTEALLRHLPTPAVEFRTVLTRVRAEVARATNNAQTPWSNDGLLTELFLAGRDATAAAPAPAPVLAPIVPGVPAEAMELVFWQSVQGTQRPEELEEFLRRFPDGTFAGLARSRLAEMRRPEAPRDAGRPAADAEAERRPAEAARIAETERARVAAEEAERARIVAAEQARAAEAEAERRRLEIASLPRPPAPEPGPAADPEAAERALSLGRGDWAEIQRALGALGFQAGTPDGVAGPRTRAALRAWQEARRLPGTGFLAESDRARLREEARAPLARLAEEERRRGAEAPPARLAAAFSQGDVTALSGCWRWNASGDSTGHRELCFSGRSGVSYSHDVRWNNGTVNLCRSRPARIAAWDGQTLTIDAPQTTGQACWQAIGATDFSREVLVCRAGARPDQLACDFTSHRFNSPSFVFARIPNMVFTRR